MRGFTLDAIRLTALLEGMITDPVYEGTMAALIDLVRNGEIPPVSTILYAHLGGQPALNAACSPPAELLHRILGDSSRAELPLSWSILGSYPPEIDHPYMAGLHTDIVGIRTVADRSVTPDASGGTGQDGRQDKDATRIPLRALCARTHCA
jgi:hypothetical protein